jgi:uncharacterized protein YidB (DUF937 family)
MFENLLALVKGEANEAIVNNPAIPNEHNDAAIHTAATGIFDSLKNAVSNGNLSDITAMFQQGGGNIAANPMMSGISQNVVGSLMNKFGINESAAGGIVASLLPSVMSKLVHKTNDPNDSSFDIGGILSSLGGGATSGAGGLLGGLVGKIFGA